ncbi:MAG: PAS domain S-box protein [Desulfobulbaceae bacterium]|nr:PAS domain S-box protein [Desulfobulbaceae bacterium]
MKNYTAIRLRLWIPILVFGTFCLLLLFFTFREHYQEELNSEERAVTSLREQLARTGPRFEDLRRKGLDSLVEAGIADLSIPAEVRAVVLVDARGGIIYGSRLEWRNHPGGEVLPGFDQGRFHAAQLTRRPDIHLTSDRNGVLAYQPVVLAAESGQIRPSLVGMIFVDYDLSGAKASMLRALVVKVISVWVVGILLMLSLWKGLSRWLTSPLYHLKEVVSRFSHGDYQVRAEVAGNGELAELSLAFNAMAEEVLRNSSRLQAVLNSATESAIIATDLHGLVTVFNPGAERMLGYAAEEVLGKETPLLWHLAAEISAKAEEFSRALGRPVTGFAVFTEFVRQGKVLAEEWTMVRKDGVQLNTRLVVTAIRDEKEQITGYLGVAEDISQRKQAEQELQERQERLRSLSNNLPNGYIYQVIIIPDGRRCFAHVSAGVEKIHALTPQAVMADPGLLYGQITADDQLRLQAAEEEAYRNLATFFAEVRFFVPGGNAEVRWLSLSSSPRALPDGGVAFDGLAIDITERKRTEAALERAATEWSAAMDASNDVIYLLDVDRRLIRANKAFYQMTNLAPETVTGRHIAEIIHPQGEVTPCPVCCAQIEKRDFVVIMEADHPDNPAGRPIEITVKIIRDKLDHPVSIFMSLHDLTLERQAQQEKTKLEAQLRQAQKMEAIGTLAGGIAHDFNNILTPILGYSEIVAERLPAGSDEREMVQEILNAGGRAKELTKQILTFSRNAEQSRQPVRMDLIVKEALKLLRSSIPTTIAIRQDVVECGLVLADPIQIHQVLMNLCTNAYHAMRENGGELRVGLAVVELTAQDYLDKLALQPGPHVKLSVSDTGCGMPKEIVERIFEPYFTTKKQGEGTGLGLAVVHGIVRSYQGHITVYSEPGQGTEFHVYLPQIKVRDEGEGKESAAPVIPLGSGTVLVVDDEEVICHLQQKVLQSLGYEVLSCASSSQALEIFRENCAKIDLVLTDMTMPEMNGAELAFRVKQICPTTPVILCTGFSDIMDEEKARRMGIDAYLLKPINRQQLAQTLYGFLPKKT